MSKETFAAAGLERKPYAKPQFCVVEIDSTDIICTSGQDLDYDDRYRNGFGEN